ncbi:LysE/ArgO family amino acid transporter [Geopsychrobacter electrodiphilus]|uniref:LysE/ArgO family amino acid transporter n=1 Tax=Geopsychrobacter electrodiphilus TaxID=225196 RepID=UPI0003775004|nr:LysE/ArgO family amino acid transporter [Geopsychrobacter electrodiphilus]
MLSIYLQGFLLTAGLIIAIGAQNAFVLSNAVRGNRPLLIAGLCIGGDLLLIGLGLAGVGTLVASHPELMRFAAFGGAMFLGVYGMLALRSALRGTVGLQIDDALPPTRNALILATLAVTFLNPHAYLDTVVLIGGIGGQFPVDQRLIFGAGAVTASFIWFLTLGFGGPYLAPLFRRRSAWRLLDGLVCLMMWGIALTLVKPYLPG